MTKTIQSLHKYPNAHNTSYHGRDIQGNIWSHQLLFFFVKRDKWKADDQNYPISQKYPNCQKYPNVIVDIMLK
jgi:hypothetical protein